MNGVVVGIEFVEMKLLGSLKFIVGQEGQLHGIMFVEVIAFHVVSLILIFLVNIWISRGR